MHACAVARAVHMYVPKGQARPAPVLAVGSGLDFFFNCLCQREKMPSAYIGSFQSVGSRNLSAAGLGLLPRDSITSVESVHMTRQSYKLPRESVLLRRSPVLFVLLSIVNTESMSCLSLSDSRASTLR